MNFKKIFALLLSGVLLSNSMLAVTASAEEMTFAERAKALEEKYKSKKITVTSETSFTTEEGEVVSYELADYTSLVYTSPKEKLATMKKMLSHGDYELWILEETGEIALVTKGKDGAEDHILFSNPYDVAGMTKDAKTKEKLLSQILINFNNGSQSTDYNSYEWAAKLRQIKVEPIRGGIRVNYTMGREQARILVPERIEKQRFEEKILNLMPDDIKDPKLGKVPRTYIKAFFNLKDPDAVSEGMRDDMYKTFPITEKYAIYILSDATVRDKKLIEYLLTTYTDYTFDDLDEDHTKVEHEASVDKLPLFKVSIEYFLDDDGLTVKVPASDIRFDSSTFNISEITILPYFGAGAKDETGFTLVNDGSGSIVRFEDVADREESRSISSKVYGQDYSFHKIGGENQEVMRLPTFGTIVNTEYYDFDEEAYRAALESGEIIAYDDYEKHLELTIEEFFEKEKNKNKPKQDETSSDAKSEAAEAPAADGANEAPATDGANEAPAADGANEAPAADGANEAPATDGANEAPATDGANEAPTTDGANETPAADGADETPAKEGEKAEDAEANESEKSSANSKNANSGAYVKLEDEMIPMSAGFVAYISEGESLATIYTEHGGSVHDYNTAYAKFTPRPTDSYKLEGLSANASNEWSVTSKRKYTGNFTIKYMPVRDEKATTAGMAEAVRDYLVGEGVLSKLDDNSKDIPLYIETFGSIKTTQRIAGIPFEVQTPLTTFADAKTMIDELTGKVPAADGQTYKTTSNIVIKYTGWYNGGLYKTVPSKINIDKKISEDMTLAELAQYASGVGAKIYPDVEFTYVNDVAFGDGFNYKDDAVQTIDGRTAVHKVYSALFQMFEPDGQLILSPVAMEKYYTKIIENYKKLGVSGISVATLGSDLSSDHNEDYAFTREDSKEAISDLLGYMKADTGSVLISGGNAYALKYADHILDLPLNSSENVFASDAVPFLGMVLHGYKNFAGTAINLDGDYEKSVLKAIENGASPYFILSYQHNNTSELKSFVDFSKYYSIRYNIWLDKLTETYNTLNNALSSVKYETIVGHEILDTRIVRVTYSNGESFVLNYNIDDKEYVDSEGNEFTVEKMNFLKFDKNGEVIK